MTRPAFCMISLALLAAEPRADDDWLLTLRARQALWNHDATRDFTVGVQARSGVVRIWGSVATTQAADAIKRRLASVPGVRGVESEMIVPATAKPAVPPPAEPTAVQARYPLVPDVIQPVRAMESSGISTPHAIPSTSTPLPKATTLAERIEAVRINERRYASVQCQIQAGQVTVGGSVREARDAWDFAAALRAIPGVVGVTLRTRVE